MLLITSRSHIDEGLKFSFDHISEIAKDSFYLKYESAFISDTADYTKAPCYIVLPYGLASILKGASVAIIKGYGLKKCESDESHCFVYEATPNDDEEKIDIITDDQLYLGFDGPNLKIYLAEGWKLKLVKDQQPIIQNGEKSLVCGEDIAAQYEGTPAECYCWMNPNIENDPAVYYYNHKA